MADEKECRQFDINSANPTEGNLYPSNYVSTAKYTLLTLVPKNLFEQFHRVANIWFLVVSFFQVLPLELSPTSSWATIAPLSLVLTVTMLKDAYLDYKRHQSDKEINNREVLIWKAEATQFQKWSQLQVGNIVVLKENQPVPADLVLLTTSHQEKICYIETSNLDGESNLKIKSSLPDTAELFEGSLEECLEMLHKLDQAVLKSEHPNNRLYTYEGTLKLKGHPRSTPIENSNLLLRGSTLKNTNWAVGVVVFTGVDTKLMMNSKAAPHKRSNVELRVNRYLVIVFSLLFVAATLSTVISVVYSYTKPTPAEYFAGQSVEFSVLNFITFMILYNSLVPISLYVSMDIVRVIQAKFIQWDLKMYYEPLDRPAITKTGDLNEDLGQIEYVFSDKTGTLTENRMEFKQCSIKGKVYGSLEGLCEEVSVNKHSKFKFYDKQILEDLNGPNGKNVEDFLKLLSICHTVIPKEHQGQEITYQAASPDEEALVIAAHSLGYSFQKASAGLVSLVINGVQKDFNLLGVNEFTSDRKRMSVVVEDLDTPGKATLYCKGADNVMLDRVDADSSETELLGEQLHFFAVSGLRTLVVAKRELNQEEVQDFCLKWNRAKNAMSDRTKMLENVAEEFEAGMELIGATAIEDKIQEGVPETIASLMEGGVKVWVLTGDKQETAINIGYSCQMLKEDMDIVKINANSPERTKDLLKEALYNNVYSSECNQNFSRSLGQLLGFQEGLKGKVDIDKVNLGLVVDGGSLQFVLNDLEAMKLFIMVTSMCHAVICCRVSPLQKAQVVKLVKEHLKFKPLTLAIGDGANDVSMIQEAHVGIGICGNEGLQAVNSSDYSVARFKHLLPLLFLHGRWNYQRISRVILYSFYKNFLLVLPMFYFSFLNQYSGTALYDSWLIMSYNVALTSLPVMVLGCIDKDLEDYQVLRNPQLYQEGIHSKLFNAKVFLKWTGYAVVQGLLVFGVIFKASSTALDPNGNPEDLLVVGTVAFHSVVQTASYVVLLETKDWNWIFLSVTFLSYIAFYPYVFFYDYLEVPTANLIGVSTKIFEMPVFLLLMLLVPVICVMLNVTEKFTKALLLPKRSFERVLPQSSYEVPGPRLLHMRSSEYVSDLEQIFDPKNTKLASEAQKTSISSDYSLRKYTLKFMNPYFEKSYCNYRNDKVVGFVRYFFGFLFAVNLVWSIADIAVSEHDKVIILLRIITIFLVFLVTVFSRTDYFKHHYENIMLIIIVGSMAGKLVLETIAMNDASMSTAMVPILTFVLFRVSTYKVFVANVVFLVCYLVRVNVKYSYEGSPMIGLKYLALLVGITLVSAFVGFSLEKSRRTQYVLQKKLEFQMQKGQEILGNLLPKFVKERVKQGVRYIAEDQGTVTVLFCDIYNFDQICATHTPKELIDLLDKFFAILDNLCEKHGVTKIETVNKTYMVCGGLKDSEENLPPHLLAKNHAVRCVELAFEILNKIEPVYLKTGEKFRVKIGINSGPVIAGVVGEHKPQFSLVGDTVNTASRMCSTIKHPDALQISKESYNFVKHMSWNFLQDHVEAKGKGNLTTYYVSKPTKRNHYRKVTLQDLQPPELPQEELDCSSLPLLSEDPQEPPAKKPEFEALTPQKSENDEELLGLAGPVQWLTCSFWENRNQNQFRVYTIQKEVKNLALGLWMTIVIYAVLTVIFGLSLKTFNAQFALRLICLGLMLGLVVSLKKTYQHSTFPWVVMVIYIITSSSSILSLFSVEGKFLYVVVLEVMYTNVVINHISCLPFGQVLIASIINFTHWVTVTLVQGENMGETLEATFFILVFVVINGGTSYLREDRERKVYNLNLLAQREILNTEKLLNQMMPPQVVQNLKNDITTTDKYDNVTMIFADICGFTQYSSDKNPIEVVGMLSKLFCHFDQLCVKNNVYKVHTIGDCYVILSFNELYESNKRNPEKECSNMVNMALDMIKEIKRVNFKKGLSLDMRIGVHTGEVVAGITGTNIVRYDIYGPDVDIANKMESGGQPGRINASEVTKALLETCSPGRFEYVFNKSIRHEPTEKELQSFFLKPLFPEDIEI